MPATIDSNGKPGIRPPCVTLRVRVKAWPLVVIDIVCVVVTPPLLIVAAYVPGGTEKVTTPCESVTPWTGAGRHGVTTAGVRTTLAFETGFPWMSTTLMLIVTFAGHTMLTVDAVVVVTAVVEVEAVDRIIDVEVVENTPPYGANSNIVESGVL